MWLQLYKEIEICHKATKVIRFDKTESNTIGHGTYVCDSSPQFSTRSETLCQIDFLMDFIESCFDNYWKKMTQWEHKWS